MGNCCSLSQKKSVLFRDAKYHKYATVGKRRVKDGECCSIWDRRGRVRNVTGPKLVRIFMSDVRFLDRFVADQNSYLEIVYRTGAKEHVRGPAAMFLDPVQHEAINVRDALSLNAFEAVVVYREMEPVNQQDHVALAADSHSCEDESKNAVAEGLPAASTNAAKELALEPSVAGYAGDAAPQPLGRAINLPQAIALPCDGKRVQRRIVRGPTLFIPAANEWVHQFSWHGSNNRMDDERTMIKDALKLTKIRTLPDQLYYNVRQCRTSDDAQLCVKLMVFFTMQDMEKMLDSTHDPIGDFVNAVSADVIRFAAERTFEQFISRSGELNELRAFPVLVERARVVGYRIDKVVFRGYKASEQLQAMHDTAIKMRTKLQLESKTAEQEQSIEDLKLNRTLERSAKEREMETAQRTHALQVADLEHEQQLRQQQQAARMKLDEITQRDKQKLRFLSELAQNGVDLTKYLVAQERREERVVRVEAATPNCDTDAGNHSAATPHVHIVASS